MKRLMNQIKTDAKKRGITGKIISRWIKVSEGMVTKYYKAESDMPAIKFIELVQFIYDDELDKIKKAILEFIQKTERTDNLQELLEWSTNTGDNEYIDEVQKRTVFTSLVKDAMIYKMIRERNAKKTTPEDFYLKIEDFKMSENLMFDSKILLKIATLYAQLDMKSYSVMVPLANHIMDSLDVVNSEYLQQSFRLRTLEMLAHAHLKLGETAEVERISQEFLSPEIMSRFPLPSNSILLLLAESNVFENPQKSIEMINQAIKMLKVKRVSSHLMRTSVLEATHDFIKIYNNDFEDLFLNDLSERAHYCAKKGYIDEALLILEELEKQNNGLSAHQYYYKGIATNNSKYFQIALNKFARQGDSFYTKLIKIT